MKTSIIYERLRVLTQQMQSQSVQWIWPSVLRGHPQLHNTCTPPRNFHSELVMSRIADCDLEQKQNDGYRRTHWTSEENSTSQYFTCGKSERMNNNIMVSLSQKILENPHSLIQVWLATNWVITISQKDYGCLADIVSCWNEKMLKILETQQNGQETSILTECLMLQRLLRFWAPFH